MTSAYTVAAAFPTGQMALPSTSVTYPGTTTDGQNSPIKLGTRVKASNGQELVWVQAGAAISTTLKEPYALAIDPSFQAVKLTQTLAKLGQQIGVAPPIVISDNDFFWAVVEGSHVPLRVAASAVPGLTLYTTATAGRLDDTSGGSHQAVLGIKLVTTASSSASAGSTVRECVMTSPIALTAFALQ